MNRQYDPKQTTVTVPDPDAVKPIILEPEDTAELFPLLMDLFDAISERRKQSPTARQVGLGRRVTKAHRAAAISIVKIGDRHGF